MNDYAHLLSAHLQLLKFSCFVFVVVIFLLFVAIRVVQLILSYMCGFLQIAHHCKCRRIVHPSVFVSTSRSGVCNHSWLSVMYSDEFAVCIS